MVSGLRPGRLWISALRISASGMKDLVAREILQGLAVLAVQARHAKARQKLEKIDSLSFQDSQKPFPGSGTTGFWPLPLGKPLARNLVDWLRFWSLLWSPGATQLLAVKRGPHLP